MVENKRVMARNILKYLHEQDLTAADLCKDLGIKSNTFSDWVNAKSYPRIDKIEMMANYFGVSKAALVEETPVLPFGELTKREQLIISFYRVADETTRKIIDKILNIDEYESERSTRIFAFKRALETLSEESINRLLERTHELQELEKLEELKRNLEKKKDSE